MSDRSRKRPRDANELAAQIVDEATREKPQADKPPPEAKQPKRPS